MLTYRGTNSNLGIRIPWLTLNADGQSISTRVKRNRYLDLIKAFDFTSTVINFFLILIVLEGGKKNISIKKKSAHVCTIITLLL